MLMDYFRRPQIAGKALTRLDNGTVRGSLRRNDPDGTSAVPYFSGVATGETLIVDADGVEYVATLTGATPTYSSILADINTALGVNGEAFDEDGSIGIRTLVPGGFVQVTGGTAARALGFDVARHRIRSAGGDLPYTPERRVGNPFGAALPYRGENLTIESMNKAFGRILSNMDVLFSEHARQDARMVKVAAASTTITSPAAGTSLIELPAATRVFTGLNILPTTPTAVALAPYVQLIDPETGLPPATCRVIDIVRGAVAGAPPYGDAPNYAGAGSVVNVDLVKASGTINSIMDGRVIEVLGATFTTNGTKVGDWVKITGATNLTPFSHNGYRWVVEEVIDATHIAVRPMSKTELLQATPAGTFTEEQPIVELNDNRSGLETYGTVEVRTGTHTDAVKLVVQPQIPVGASYDVWVCQPVSVRELDTGAAASLPAVADVVSQHDPLPNGVIRGFTVSGSGASSTLAEGFIRVHGKILRIPEKVYSPADFSSVDGDYVVYFDESDGRVKTASSLSGLGKAEDDPSGDLAGSVLRTLARFTVSGTGTNIAGHTMARYSTFGTERITVGNGGSFLKLREAVQFINEWAVGHGESEDDDLSDSIHFEIVLLEDVALEENITLRCPAVSIKGVNPNAILDFAGFTITLKDVYALDVSNLRYDASGGAPLFTLDVQTEAAKATDIFCRRVRAVSTALNTVIVQGANNGRLNKLVLEDSYFIVTSGLAHVDSSGSSSQEIYLLRSRLATSSFSTTGVMFRTQSGDWAGRKLSVKDCRFEGWAAATGTVDGLMMKPPSGHSCDLIVEDNIFAFGTFAADSNTLLISTTGVVSGPVVKFNNNRGTAMVPRVIQATIMPSSSAAGNSFTVKPEGSSSVAFDVSNSICNTIDGAAPSGATRGALMRVSLLAMGNYITGVGRYGIKDTGGTARFIGNTVVLSSSGESAIDAACIVASGAHSRVDGNLLYLTAANGFGVAGGCACVVLTGAQPEVRGNVLSATAAFGIASPSSATEGILEDNHLLNSSDSAAEAAGIWLAGGIWTVNGNLIKGGGATYYAIRLTGSSTTLEMAKNYCATPLGFRFNAATIASLRVLGGVFTGDLGDNFSHTIMDCRVGGDATFDGSADVRRCHFYDATGAIVLVSSSGTIKFVGNTVATTIDDTGSDGGAIEFYDNHCTGTVTLTSAAGQGVYRVERSRFTGVSSFDMDGMLRGNYFTAPVTIVVSDGAILSATQNRTTASITLTAAVGKTGRLMLHGNSIFSSLVQNMANDAPVFVDGNYISGNVTRTGTHGVDSFCNNVVGGTAELINGTVSNNTFAGAVVVANCTFGGNVCLSTVASRNATTVLTGESLPFLVMQGNRITGAVTISPVNYNVVLSSNRIRGAVSITSQDCEMSNNRLFGALSLLGSGTFKLSNNVVDGLVTASGDVTIVGGAYYLGVTVSGGELKGKDALFGGFTVTSNSIFWIEGSVVQGDLIVNGFDDNHRIIVRSCHLFDGSVTINSASAAPQAGSEVFISDTHSESAVTVEGAALLTIRGSYLEAGLTISHITDSYISDVIVTTDVDAGTSVENFYALNSSADSWLCGMSTTGALLFMRNCGGQVITEDSTPSIDIAGAYDFGLDAGFAATRAEARVVGCDGSNITVGVSERAYIHDNDCSSHILVGFATNTKLISIKDNRTDTGRGTEGIYILPLSNSAVLETLVIDGNNCKVDNSQGSGIEGGTAIQIGDPDLSDANDARIRHLCLNNNTILVTPFNNDVVLAADQDHSAIVVDAKVYGGTLCGNGVDVPRPLQYTTGFLRYKILTGFTVDILGAGASASGNQFIGTRWNAGAPPTFNFSSIIANDYHDGTGTVSPSAENAVDDLCGGGHRRLSGASAIAKVAIPATDLSA